MCTVKLRTKNAWNEVAHERPRITSVMSRHATRHETVVTTAVRLKYRAIACNTKRDGVYNAGHVEGRRAAHDQLRESGAQKRNTRKT